MSESSLHSRLPRAPTRPSAGQSGLGTRRVASVQCESASARARAAAPSAATGTRTRCVRVGAFLARTRMISARARASCSSSHAPRHSGAQCPTTAMTASSMEVFSASYRDVATCSECVMALRMQPCTMYPPAESPCSSNLFYVHSQPHARAAAQAQRHFRSKPGDTGQPYPSS